MFHVTPLNDGLGFGSGKISGGSDTAPAGILAAVDDAIMNNTDILVPLDADDDGCGDGRAVKAVSRDDEILERNSNRAKIFGGGLAMGVAARIGSGLTDDTPLQKLFASVSEELDQKHLNYGAHTDDHAAGEKCGCGAIDLCPQAIANVAVFAQPIRVAIEALGIDSTNFNHVIANFVSYGNAIADQSFSGAEVMHTIQSRHKIIKQLAGDHKEKRIIVNMVDGMTVNQSLIRQVSGGAVQVFATDAWRLSQIADTLSGDDATLRQQIFLSELVYTLSVAGTLTAGDLPVYIVSG